ncbi:hypothetical protein [Pelosinus fermentans]|uniref:hypothetical protein n=1 Tax=Pelosinus fermentans TaxID=365349 RepID=UPI000562ED68|nr:hypothetical protein [Pelosinus fermentans]
MEATVLVQFGGYNEGYLSNYYRRSGSTVVCNPLGTACGSSQRKAIAALADKYNVFIVEDDYCSDISLNHKYDLIYAYGDHFHHIYLKRFSKRIPWFRMGL